jgi:hypothetical protein
MTFPQPRQNPLKQALTPTPLIIKAGESGTSILTITALEEAELGTNTMFVQMGNWEQTGLGGATLRITIMPK